MTGEGQDLDDLRAVITALIERFHGLVTEELMERYGHEIAFALRLGVYAGLVACGLCDEARSQDHLIEGLEMSQKHIRELTLASWALRCAESFGGR